MSAEDDPDRPQLKTSSSFNKGGDPIPALSGDAAGSVTKFAFGGKAGDVIPEPVRTDDGFLVVQIKEHKVASKEDFAKDSDTYLQTLLTAKQAEALALYVKRLREAAKGVIKIDETYTVENKGGKDGGAPAQDMDDDEQ